MHYNKIKSKCGLMCLRAVISNAALAEQQVKITITSSGQVCIKKFKNYILQIKAKIKLYL